MRHGCPLILLFAVVAQAANPPADQFIAKPGTRQFDVQYDVNPDALPLTRVELWYTFDQGASWHISGVDEDLASPIRFAAPQEGLCGLYFVIANDAGPSGPPPQPDTNPHQWVYVDHTPPVCQLHEPIVEWAGGPSPKIQIRWSVVDEHLLPRPITLAYRSGADGEWREVQSRLPNSGRYDWMPPADAGEAVTFRLTAFDRGNHKVECVGGTVSLRRPEPVKPVAVPVDVPAAIEPVTTVPSTKDVQRAKDVFARARHHIARGEVELAAGRLRDAVRIDPSMFDALVELGNALYALDELDESAGAYEQALAQRPGSRDALIGLARTFVRQKRFGQAQETLRRVVDANPKDAESWLHLGDIAVYRGDEVTARQCYVKASELSAQDAAMAKRARQRMEALPSLTRQYRNEVDVEGLAGR